MRKIVHPTADHNTTPGALRLPAASLLLICLGLVALLAGCGGGQEQDSASKTSPGRDCPGQVEIAGWTEFTAISDRLAQGTEVPRSELEAYSEVPAVAVWRRSQQPNVPRPANLANWIEGAWWDELGREGKRKLNANRVTLGRTYRYSHEHKASIDALLSEFTAGPRLCEVTDLLETWMTPANIPQPLVLSFLPANPEVRIFEDQIIIDTSVLQAGGPDQTVRQIATLLYRRLEALEGTSPIETEGAAAVAECFRVFMNEGVAGWIEQTTSVEFDDQHPSLYKVRIVPEDFFRKTQQTVENLETLLPPLLGDSARMTAGAERFAKVLTGNNAFSQTGIGMAQVIVDRLGVEKLQEVRLSVPRFIAAYQEAALQNPSPAPEPGALGIRLSDSVPPLTPELYTPLMALLEEYFASE